MTFSEFERTQDVDRKEYPMPSGVYYRPTAFFKSPFMERILNLTAGKNGEVACKAARSQFEWTERGRKVQKQAWKNAHRKAHPAQ